MIGVRRSLSAVQRVWFQSEAEDVWVMIFNEDGWRVFVVFIYLLGITARSCVSQKKIRQNLEWLSGEGIIIYGNFNFPYIDWSPSECVDFFVPMNLDNLNAFLNDHLSFADISQHNIIRNCDDTVLDLVFSTNIRLEFECWSSSYWVLCRLCDN